MLDVKEAVKSATTYFAGLVQVVDVRLEEVEISDDERFWYVTLSGLIPSAKTVPPGHVLSGASSLADLFKGDFERIFRVFTVDSSSGSVRSMKMRRVA